MTHRIDTNHNENQQRWTQLDRAVWSSHKIVFPLLTFLIFVFFFSIHIAAPVAANACVCIFFLSFANSDIVRFVNLSHRLHKPLAWCAFDCLSIVQHFFYSLWLYFASFASLRSTFYAYFIGLFIRIFPTVGEFSCDISFFFRLD